METIRNYLETMFANLPDNADVRRAKNELWQMMEDKYEELTGNGTSENEAVGRVISEFGNLDELREMLGLDEKLLPEPSTETERRMLTMDEVRDFLHFGTIKSFAIAAGVALCILSVTGPIFTDALGHFESLGIFWMFILILVAVAMFVVTGVIGKTWEYIEKENCSIDFATSAFVENEKSRYNISYTVQLTIGIVLCCLCWMPAAFLDSFRNIGFLVRWADTFGGIFLFATVAIGVFLIIHAGIMKGCYTTLLKLNDRDTISGSYVKNERRYEDPKMETAMDIYWPTVRSIYLIWSFLTFHWWKTWIIWPIAGILRGIINAALDKKEVEK
ncbi:MAG: permease prefix domain 1-containing protein [Lachnospiraceae bacterium]|nr:permease prefix domain 1-containing protein [Lachnospiraceae bacterium]